MKKQIFIITIVLQLFISKVNTAQTSSWLWAQKAGSNVTDVAMSTKTDASGNVYVTGFFRGSNITFGSTVLTNASVNTSDIFIVKYNSAGVVQWAKSAGGSSFDEPSKLTVDANGNIYVAGFFNSTSIIFGSTNLVNAGSSSGFVTKYDPNGNVLWAKKIGTNSNDLITSVCTDPSNNVYVTGAFKSVSIVVGTFTLNNTNTSATTQDGFIIKYNTGGAEVWAKTVGSDAFDEGIDLVADASNNLYLTGIFTGTNLVIGTNTLVNTNAAKVDLFVAKYNATTGLPVWANSKGNSIDDEIPSGIALDPSGNVYLSGYYYSANVNFGVSTITNAGSSTSDLFIAKYNSSGTILWVKSVGGSSNEFSSSLSIDALGNPWISGNFYSNAITFGTTVLSNTTSTSNCDLFYTKYDPNGNVLSANKLGGDLNDIANSIHVDNSANIYLAGQFASTSIDFPPFTLTNAAAGNSDMFVAKYGLGSSSTNLNQFAINTTDFKIYPNPTTGKLIFVSTISKNIDSPIEIYNTIGNKVLLIIPSSFEQEIDLTPVPSGIYFVKYNNHIMKVIKNN